MAIELFIEFRDLLVELCDAGAEFAVVGGHAVAFHGHPRATKDLDEVVREGLGFEVEGRRVPVIGLAALLANKRAAGRPQDVADVEALERIHRLAHE